MKMVSLLKCTIATRMAGCVAFQCIVYTFIGLIPFPIEEIIRKFPMLNDFDYEFSDEERKSFPYPPISMP